MDAQPLNLEDVYVDAVLDGGEAHLLRGVTLRVRPGEWVQVLGPNGSGKSTLAKLLAGHPGLIAGGAARVRGAVSRGFAGQRPLPYVTQEPDAAIVGSTPWEDIALALEQLADAQAADPAAEAQRLLRLCGLWERRDDHVEMLSGGQKQMLAAAGCLASRSPLVVFDEAAAMLDSASRGAVIAGARAIRREGAAVVWISHRLDELAAGDRVVALAGGRVAFDGGAASFFMPGGETPSGVTQDGERTSPCERLGYRPPYAVLAARELRRLGVRLEPLPLTPEELAGAVSRL